MLKTKSTEFHIVLGKVESQIKAKGWSISKVAVHVNSVLMLGLFCLFDSARKLMCMLRMVSAYLLNLRTTIILVQKYPKFLESTVFMFPENFDNVYFIMWCHLEFVQNCQMFNVIHYTPWAIQNHVHLSLNNVAVCGTIT